jgi:hypothetical protein
MVTVEHYVAMLNEFLLPELCRHHNDIRLVWFQDNGTTSHTARNSMQTVQEMFPGHVISRNGDVAWPPCSPDLSPCDFFLWGHLKAQGLRVNLTPFTSCGIPSGLRSANSSGHAEEDNGLPQVMCRGLFAEQWSSSD